MGNILLKITSEVSLAPVVNNICFYLQTNPAVIDLR